MKMKEICFFREDYPLMDHSASPRKHRYKQPWIEHVPIDCDFSISLQSPPYPPNGLPPELSVAVENEWQYGF